MSCCYEYTAANVQKGKRTSFIDSFMFVQKDDRSKC